MNKQAKQADTNTELTMEETKAVAGGAANVLDLVTQQSAQKQGVWGQNFPPARHGVTSGNMQDTELPDTTPT